MYVYNVNFELLPERQQKFFKKPNGVFIQVDTKLRVLQGGGAILWWIKVPYKDFLEKVRKKL